MEVRVLGPLVVVGEGGAALDLPSAAQRRLICFLVQAGTAVSGDSLTDHLELSPGALRTALSRLRRILGPDSVVSIPPGYALRAERIDATVFEEILARAAALEGGHARGLLDYALGLWRGEAYEEFAHEEWAL